MSAIVATKRKVNITSTKGKTMGSFETSATTWGELKKELEKEGFDLDDTKVYDGISKYDFSNVDALLPVNSVYKGEVTNTMFLFITPDAKIKSGAGISRYDLYNFIYYTNAKNLALFNEGRSYTNKTTAELQEIYDRIKTPAKIVKAPAPVVITKAEVKPTMSKESIILFNDIKNAFQKYLGIEETTKEAKTIVLTEAEIRSLFSFKY